MTLERHRSVEAEDTPGFERLDSLWVTGPLGAVSTWFSNTKSVIGYSVCDGPVVHAHDPGEAGESLWHGSEACPFIDGVCHWRRANVGITSSPGRGHPVVAAYDGGDIDAVYEWLETYYASELEDPC